MVLRAPYPWFGGKSAIAAEVWRRFGNVPNYIEPFFGSGAILLARPHKPHTETINDKDAMVSNFWRALQADPEAVAHYVDWPVNENDLHARHAWLVEQKTNSDFVAKLEGDPEFYDAKIAGWWAWGLCNWIGSGFCSGRGPWHRRDGLLVRTGDDGEGVWRQLPYLNGRASDGIIRRLPHLGDSGRGVVRQLPHLNNPGRGVNRTQQGSNTLVYLQQLAERMRRVRVTCGDWTRIMGPSITWGANENNPTLTGVVLDPPYSMEGRTEDIYAHDEDVSEAARQWAIQNGDNPSLRIVYFGFDAPMPSGWEAVIWKQDPGYGGQSDGAGRVNRERERAWFSPHCLKEASQPSLFDMLVEGDYESESE